MQNPKKRLFHKEARASSVKVCLKGDVQSIVISSWYVLVEVVCEQDSVEYVDRATAVKVGVRIPS
jgi:hypothetical protein